MKVENIKETLDGDLTVSDSEDEEEAKPALDEKKPVLARTSQPNDEFFESDDETDRRFSKLKSERQEDEISLSVKPDLDVEKPVAKESKSPVADVKAASEMNKASEKPKVFETLLEEAVHGFKVIQKHILIFLSIITSPLDKD